MVHTGSHQLYLEIWIHYNACFAAHPACMQEQKWIHWWLMWRRNPSVPFELNRSLAARTRTQVCWSASRIEWRLCGRMGCIWTLWICSPLLRTTTRCTHYFRMFFVFYLKQEGSGVLRFWIIYGVKFGGWTIFHHLFQYASWTNHPTIMHQDIINPHPSAWRYPWADPGWYTFIPGARLWVFQRQRGTDSLENPFLCSRLPEGWPTRWNTKFISTFYYFPYYVSLGWSIL